jgi:hypothetical protein
MCAGHAGRLSTHLVHFLLLVLTLWEWSEAVGSQVRVAGAKSTSLVLVLVGGTWLHPSIQVCHEQLVANHAVCL